MAGAVDPNRHKIVDQYLKATAAVDTDATRGKAVFAKRCANCHRLEGVGHSLGPDQNGWRWDRIHRTRPRHTLSAAFPDLADLLDPPSVGVGGDGDTPQNGSYGGAAAADFTVTRHGDRLLDADAPDADLQ